MTDRSRKQSSERLEQAEREADEITLAARTRLRSLDADVDRIWLERQRLIDDTRRLAERLLEIADQAEERFPAEEEDPATEDTTVGEPVRAPANQDDTLRFTPPGMLGSDPKPFGVVTDDAGALSAEPRSPFDADRGDAAEAGGGVSELDRAPEVHGASDPAPSESSPWSRAPASPEPDADSQPGPWPPAPVSHESDAADRAPGADAERDAEPLISWSTPDPERDPPPDDVAPGDGGPGHHD